MRIDDWVSNTMRRAFSFGDKSIEGAVRRVNEVRCIAVIGAGTMGRGIAADVLKKTDCQVILLDVQAGAAPGYRETLCLLGPAGQRPPDP